MQQGDRASCAVASWPRGCHSCWSSQGRHLAQGLLMAGAGCAATAHATLPSRQHAAVRARIAGGRGGGLPCRLAQRGGAGVAQRPQRLALAAAGHHAGQGGIAVDCLQRQREAPGRGSRDAAEQHQARASKQYSSGVNCLMCKQASIMRGSTPGGAGGERHLPGGQLGGLIAARGCGRRSQQTVLVVRFRRSLREMPQHRLVLCSLLLALTLRGAASQLTHNGRR